MASNKEILEQQIQPDESGRPKIKRRVLNRDKLEADIAAEAVRVFAEYGYEGASIAVIAERAGLSKQNLMYYFPSKQALYQRVLDDVLDDWLARMENLAGGVKDDEDGNERQAASPEEVLRAYIQAKLRFSREQPLASRVYAMEVISGAPLYGQQIQERVVPLLRRDIDMFEQWIGEGKIAPVNATHLLFAIWAMTQSYADFAPQMTLVLKRKQLTRKDFDDAEETITRMVLAAVRLESSGPGPHGAERRASVPDSADTAA
jgi:TetR/AcrR family transcriptional regulator